MIASKKIGILGLGREGIAAAKFFQNKNKLILLEDKEIQDLPQHLQAEIDRIKAKKYFGGNFPNNLTLDYLTRSPGVRPNHPFLIGQKKKGTKITSVTNLFFQLCPCPIIGVTGTKGKGTTSTLIYELLKSQGLDAHLAGNIGLPAIETLPKLNKKSLVVLELSSFQLMDLGKSPHIAVVLMVTSEHLDWHKSTDEYLVAKQSIVKFQSPADFKVINTDYPNSLKIGKKGPGKPIFFSLNRKKDSVSVEQGKIISRLSPSEESITETEKILLPGKHNLQNVMAAVAVAKLLGVENKNIRKVLVSFKGLKYRLQLVGEKNGIRFFNDSFSTTPETTIAAIESFSSPKILILGGSGKNSDFTTLAKKIVSDDSIKALILIGDEALRIESAIKVAGGFSSIVSKGLKTMYEIVEKSYEFAKSGDVIILSPACASFGMFANYEDRGEQFTREVAKIIK